LACATSGAVSGMGGGPPKGSFLRETRPIVVKMKRRASSTTSILSNRQSRTSPSIKRVDRYGQRLGSGPVINIPAAHRNPHRLLAAEAPPSSTFSMHHPIATKPKLAN